MDNIKQFQAFTDSIKVLVLEGGATINRDHYDPGVYIFSTKDKKEFMISGNYKIKHNDSKVISSEKIPVEKTKEFKIGLNNIQENYFQGVLELYPQKNHMWEINNFYISDLRNEDVERDVKLYLNILIDNNRIIHDEVYYKNLGFKESQNYYEYQISYNINIPYRRDRDRENIIIPENELLRFQALRKRKITSDNKMKVNITLHTSDMSDFKFNLSVDEYELI
ncbi:MAG: hypothetical protein ACOCRK_05140 [bacterium]